MWELDRIFRATVEEILSRTTREGIENRVCETLASVKSYSTIWIGTVEDQDHYGKAEIEIRESAGDRQKDRISFSENETETVSRLIEDRDVGVVQRNQTDLALVPLISEEIPYGVLGVASEDGFEKEELEILEDIGRLVGFSINAAEMRKSLLSDRSIQLEFQVSDPRLFSVVLSERVSSVVEIESMVPRTDGTFLQILRTDGVPEEEITEVVDQHSSKIREYEMLSVEDGCERRWAIITSKPCIAAAISEYGGSLESATAEDGVGNVVAELPSEADVSELMETLNSEYTAVEITARRGESRMSVDRENSREEAIDLGTSAARSYLKDRLTKRQTEVLETAYLSGFFESPRRRSSVEVAEMLGISQPTFSEHIREIENEVFSAILED